MGNFILPLTLLVKEKCNKRKVCLTYICTNECKSWKSFLRHYSVLDKRDQYCSTERTALHLFIINTSAQFRWRAQHVQTQKMC